MSSLFRIAAVLCFLAVAWVRLVRLALRETRDRGRGMVDVWEHRAVFYQFIHAFALSSFLAPRTIKPRRLPCCCLWGSFRCQRELVSACWRTNFRWRRAQFSLGGCVSLSVGVAWFLNRPSRRRRLLSRSTVFYRVLLISGAEPVRLVNVTQKNCSAGLGLVLTIAPEASTR
jgi:hypothetical protein